MNYFATCSLPITLQGITSQQIILLLR